LNNVSVRTKLPTARWRRLRQSGNSLIELAVALPGLLLLLVGVGYLAGIFNTVIALNNAARAGAQYGSISVVSAADTNGMIAAAKQDAPNLTGMSVDASQCSCTTSSVTACATSYCTNNPFRTYVTVDTQLTYQTPVTFPGLAPSVTLKSRAVMQVGQ
jgi:Flp pilus assembly protein TadG